MPVEVAESMIFTPGTRLTSAQLKTCLKARHEHLISTREPKAFTVRFADRAKKASASQLAKWAKRCIKDRARVTKAWLILRAKRAAIDPIKVHDISRADQSLAMMDIEAQRLDSWMSAMRGEAETRLSHGTAH